MRHKSQLVCIEETLTKTCFTIVPGGGQYSYRQFILKHNVLQIIFCVNEVDGSIAWCRIFNIFMNNQSVRNQMRTAPEYPIKWIPHVQGDDRLVLTSVDSPQCQLIYHMNENGDFSIEGKGFNTVVSSESVPPFFFDLVSIVNDDVFHLIKT